MAIDVVEGRTKTIESTDRPDDDDNDDDDEWVDVNG